MNKRRYSMTEKTCDAGYGEFVEYCIFDNKTGCEVGVMHSRKLAEMVVDAFNRAAA